MKLSFWKLLIPMAFTLHLCLATAQTINPDQIVPSSTNGQVLITTSGVTTWSAPGCTSGNCVITNPSTTQQIVQPSGTTLSVNNLNSTYVASQYQTPAGTGNNGIANAVAAGCTGSLTAGCRVIVDPKYPQTEVPPGYDQSNSTGFQWPINTGVQDYRSGGLFLASHDPIGGQYGIPIVSGLRLTTDFDLSTYQLNGGNGYAGVPGGITNLVNFFAGDNNTQNTFGSPNVPMFSYGSIHDGTFNELNRFDSGQSFLRWDSINTHGTGDTMAAFIQISADGGVNRRDDEGTHEKDVSVTEDVNVYTGTISGTVSTGATTIPTSCIDGCGTQGQDRLLIDTNPAKTITGTFVAGSSIVSVNQIPSGVVDSSANYPVSTFVSLCYAGIDNGGGGTAACPTDGSAPTGYIPPQQNSPTQQAPSNSIVTNVMVAITGQPAAFCNSTNLQSSNSAASCYMPASGVGCLTSQQEYETVNYTYSSTTQQITLLNLTSSHINGMTFATGGMCGYGVEEKSSIYPYGTGGSGVQSQVWPVEGSLDAHTLYYITQRTNEGYGLPVLGSGSAPELSFSLGMSNFSLSGGVVTFTLASPGGACDTMYNQVSATISTANSTYNGTYPIAYVSCGGFGYSTFTYTPTAPSGTIPTTGTASYSNLGYTLYPESRINSVYDTANNSVDGNLYLQPNTVAWTNGDAIRVPHYPEMAVNDAIPQIGQFEGNQGYSPSAMGILLDGITANLDPAGMVVDNAAPASLSLGYGGVWPVPNTAYSMQGLWGRGLSMDNAPAYSVINVGGCKITIGCSAGNSNFDLFTGPPIPNGVPGVNGQDVINYDPAYNASVRGQGQYSGRFYVTNAGAGDPGFPTSPSYSTWQAGYLNADWSMTTPYLSATSLTTTQLTSPAIYLNTEGTSGSTTYNYWIVGHDFAGGATIPEESTTTSGNATLSATNYNLICIPATPGFASFDVYKNNTNTLLGTMTPFNGVVNNYACLKDTGQSTTSQTASTVNTTGAIVAQGLLQGATVNATSGYQVNGVALASSNLSDASSLMHYVGTLTLTSSTGSLAAPGVPAGAACSAQAQTASTAEIYVPLLATAGTVVVNNASSERGSGGTFSVFCQY